MRFAIFGTGFWAPFQLAGWRELEGVECVAVCDADPSKASAFARAHNVRGIYADPEKLLASERPDFVDIITSVEAHAPLVDLAVRHRCPVICQKPLAGTLAEARRMVDHCAAAGVPLFVHENWRWQAPIRAFKQILESGRLGRIIRGRIDYAHSFPVFDNQPFLKELDRFILTDMGTHILDVARFLWGEASELYCKTRRIHSGIKGEDVATVMLGMRNDVTVTANLSYASRWELDRFPETFIQVEGSEGGASLGPDYRLRLFTGKGVEEQRIEPERYAWADPAYAVIHASIVACHKNILGALRGQGPAETTGADNLETLELVFGAYESAERGAVVRF